MQPIGVIDLGTNTFHLLIARLHQGNIVEVYRERIFVQLAEEGIGTIGANAYARALDALRHYRTLLDKYEVKQVRAFGTAGLRTASNGKQLMEDIVQATNIQVQSISGDEEARLIYEGVRRSVPLRNTYSLIMDIGGGSVEFIVANEAGIQWAKSFPIGVAVLYHNFHHHDPILPEEVHAVEVFIDRFLLQMQQVLQQYQPQYLIGASGTFDILEKVLPTQRISDTYATLAIADFDDFYTKILHSTFQQRLNMADIPNSRAQLLVVALILIKAIRNKAPIQQIDISAYAMKEGMLYELAEKQTRG